MKGQKLLAISELVNFSAKTRNYVLNRDPCIFRETKFRDRKFPDRTLQEGTFGDQKIPGIPICHGI